METEIVPRSTTRETGSRLRSWPFGFEKYLFRPVIMPLQTWLYRLTRGRIGARSGSIRYLLLTTTGRKSGKVYTTPLAYIEHDGGYLVTATNAGMDRHPGWYHNLTADPRVTVRLGDHVFSASAEVVPEEQRDRLWRRLLEQIPGYAGYQRRTDRRFPMVLLRPTIAAAADSGA